MFPVLYYTLGYLVIFCWLCRCRCNILSKYIALIWFGSSLFAMLFFYLTKEVLYERIGYLPFVFLHLCFVLSIIPVVRSTFLQHINASYINIKLYKRILCFFVLISIVPFAENLRQVLSAVDSSGNELADIYDSKMYGGGFKVTWLSSIGLIGNSIDGVFLYFLLFSPFYLMTRKDVNSFYILLSMIPVSNHLLFQMAGAGRGTMVSFLLLSSFLLLLFWKSIPHSRLVKIRIWGISAIVIIGIALTAITVSRKEATNANDDTAIFIGYYIAKSHLDFNENLWNMKQHTEGDNSFAFVKYCLGLPTFKSFLDKENYWNERKIGVQPGYFYTYIGDLYMDFGPIITLLLFILTMVVALLYFNRGNRCTFVKLFIFFVYCSVLTMGWSINMFKTFDGTRNLLLSLLLIVFIHLLSLKSYSESSI